MLRVIAGLLVLSTLLQAGDSKPKGGGDTGGASGNSSAPISGIAYSISTLPTAYASPNPVILCFVLQKVDDSPLQPFILQRTTVGAGCNWPSERHPLKAGDHLVISIDATATESIERLRALVLNVSTQAGSPINAAPVRPTFTPPNAAPAAVGLPSIRYLEWPFALTGDTIPTITVNGIYRSPQLPKSMNTSGGSTSVDTTPESDEMVTLLNLTLPQVHMLYYYNVSTGVVASTLRNPNFFRVQQTGPPSPTFSTVKDGGDPTVAPVLMFTAYLAPMDAESKWQPRDLRPGITMGFSLTSPANSFYFGGSSEIRRNVQLVYGLNYAKVTSLAPTKFVDPADSTAPKIVNKFEKGAFVGFTFNIDFIKGLFGSGKSGSQ
ncbi:MAG TPA: hypothetical protein VLK33_13340 [Terriglobales bacterium]|nr:hypothetical protein [Terriglobales bacterium]